MNNNNQPSLYFTPHSLKGHKQEPSLNQSCQSPYLRAVLTDKRTSGPARVLSMTNSSLAAALRYITNSK